FKQKQKFDDLVGFNWNTWICSNWLATALILEKNKDKRVREVEKILWSLDNFLNSYPRDGGCNEGPHYWKDAGESLYESIDLLNLATDNQFNVYGNRLIKNIGTFIYKAQVTRDYFINFGDAGATLNPDGGMVYLMVGFWLTMYMLIERRLSVRRRIIHAVGVGLIVLMPTVLHQEVSYRTHAIGVVVGMLSALVYYRFARRRIQSVEVSEPLDDMASDTVSEEPWLEVDDI
ncbi:MAG: hypothetical protein P8Z74_09295, partial [Acidobacteriota bacterium]